jgi:hypothetical protein
VLTFVVSYTERQEAKGDNVLDFADLVTFPVKDKDFWELFALLQSYLLQKVSSDVKSLISTRSLAVVSQCAEDNALAALDGVLRRATRAWRVCHIDWLATEPSSGRGSSVTKHLCPLCQITIEEKLERLFSKHKYQATIEIE